MAERVYIVTFRQVDPLFVIDASNSSGPVALGELKVPGYSDYLHPLNSSHLIGIGKDMIPNEWGGTDVGGLKLSLFDARDPAAPTESYSLIVGASGTESDALYDHRAFVYQPSRRLISLPARLTSTENCASGADYIYRTERPLWQGLVLWRLGETSFELQGLVSHYDPLAAPASTEETRACAMPQCADAPSLEVTRALYIGDAVFTLSAGLVRADSLPTLRENTTAAAAQTAASAAAGLGVAATSALWSAARADSLLASVPLAHALCESEPYDEWWGVSAAQAASSPEPWVTPPPPPPPPRAPPPPALPPCPACQCVQPDERYCDAPTAGAVVGLVALAAQGVNSFAPPAAPPSSS
jgi:hypothetical protein